ncbi:hypothetical protein SAMN05421803_14325 [Nocardiopsis flavescens]|uniref:Uncharacterized protein n=1 Tax=Nocardiopsis flavescens TaxID=758803 RepID=A0A1M6WGP7_9ACTN|nr:hypothetical protein [Nocardiopsis flavescens]SHK92784.1 hypothetical protein SAMN05421803_14325 [Nocardiopsis flavescens]
MSVITEVMKRTGASRTEILRVATRGGTTQADWAIAHTIERLGGRRAADLMWGPERIPTQTPTATNPHAEHDPEITVYSEDTAPDSPNRIAPHHPHDGGEAGPLEARADQASTVHADLVDLTEDTTTAGRVSRRWASPIDAVHQAARRTVQQLLLAHPRTRRRAAHRARQARRLALAA